MSEVKPEKKASGDNTKLQKTMTIVGIVLCAILVPILIINCTLIIKSFINKDEVPGIAGYTPMIVLTDSMEPHIKGGDIIIVKDIKTEDIKPGTVISFFDPASKSGSVTTHRVIGVITDDETGAVSFKTAGDYNVDRWGEGGYDKKAVPADSVIGAYEGFRIPFVGRVAMFMQTTAGLLICILVPLALLIGIDIIRRRRNDKNQKDDVADLMAELEALKAEKAKAEAEKVQNAECGTQSEDKTEDDVKDDKESD